MIVSMVALQCYYDQGSLCREEKDAAGGANYGRRKIPSAAVGCESAMAARAEDDAAVEAGDGCVLVQDLEKNCLFGM
jgi:hypothetical protein